MSLLTIGGSHYGGIAIYQNEDVARMLAFFESVCHGETIRMFDIAPWQEVPMDEDLVDHGIVLDGGAGQVIRRDLPYVFNGRTADRTNIDSLMHQHGTMRVKANLRYIDPYDFLDGTKDPAYKAAIAVGDLRNVVRKVMSLDTIGYLRHRRHVVKEVAHRFEDIISAVG